MSIISFILGGAFVYISCETKPEIVDFVSTIKSGVQKVKNLFN